MIDSSGRQDNGGECKRDAEPVRGYLGLRSTTDPLFQIEKVFDKVKYMDDIDDLEVFFSASEEWTSAVTMSNSMAFISQFGVRLCRTTYIHIFPLFPYYAHLYIVIVLAVTIYCPFNAIAFCDTLIKILHCWATIYRIIAKLVMILLL